MMNGIRASMALFSQLVHEATVHRGLKTGDIALICIDPESEWLSLLELITPERTIAKGFACCVTDTAALHIILETLPELDPTILLGKLDSGLAKLVALSDAGVYVCSIEPLPQQTH